MEIGRVDGDFWGGDGGRFEGGPLLLDVAGAFDKGADEGFGVAVYGGYDGWGDGLGDGLVYDLRVRVSC